MPSNEERAAELRSLIHRKKRYEQYGQFAEAAKVGARIVELQAQALTPSESAVKRPQGRGIRRQKG